MTPPAKNKRAINGILLVNKSQGLTSNALLQKVKRLFNAQKAGHTGSLDPLATGMLPVCFGEATKLCQYLLDADKAYRATGRLGVKTSTADSCGEVIASVDQVNVSEQDLQKVLQQFIGVSQQIPSMYSALKHQGAPLYKLARQGIEIERQSRSITIHSLHLHHFDGLFFDITVSCSKGTYIRNLVEDIGETLGVHAHVTQLHRLYTTGFADQPMHSLDELEGKDEAELMACLLPMEQAIVHFPVLSLNEQDVCSLKQGRIIQRVNVDKTGCVRLYDTTGSFFGLGELDSEGMLKVKRLLAIN